MPRATCAALAAFFVSAAPTAPASAVELEAGIRAGYALPFGSLDKSAGQDLGGAVRGVVPIALEAGVRVRPQLTVGTFLQYAPVVQKNCDRSCSGFDTRVGLQALYRLLPAAQISPWLGLGVGYEWLQRSSTQRIALSTDPAAPPVDADVTVTHRGFEFASLQLGADAEVTGGVRLGPFAAVTLAQYSGKTTTIDSPSFSTATSSVSGNGLHGLVMAGLRGTFGL